MLSNPRYWGVGFNPVSFYFAYDGDGAVAAMIAEVTNTPWRRAPLPTSSRPAATGPIRGEFAKRLHVSPFMPMEQTYEWSSASPASDLQRLASPISDERGGASSPPGSPSSRREITLGGDDARYCFRYPPMTASTIRPDLPQRSPG